MNSRNLLIAAGFGLLIALSAWLQERTPPPPTETGRGDTPDYTLSQAAITLHDAAGRPHAVLFAAEMAHYTADDLTQLEQPVLSLDDAQGPLWTVTADHGRLLANGTVVELDGAVRLDGAPRSGRGALRIDTRDLRVDMQRRTAETAAPVTMTRPGLQLTALGMQARLVAGNTIIHLLHDVEGRHAPLAN